MKLRILSVHITISFWGTDSQLSLRIVFMQIFFVEESIATPESIVYVYSVLRMCTVCWLIHPAVLSIYPY